MSTADSVPRSTAAKLLRHATHVQEERVRVQESPLDTVIPLLRYAFKKKMENVAADGKTEWSYPANAFLSHVLKLYPLLPPEVESSAIYEALYVQRDALLATLKAFAEAPEEGFKWKEVDGIITVSMM